MMDNDFVAMYSLGLSTYVCAGKQDLQCSAILMGMN